MEEEIWKVHPVHTDFAVSSLGRVRRETAAGGTRIGRIKTASINKNGYCNVMLGKQLIRVHKLVLETFVGPRPDKHDACHNDGVRTNNRLDNLRWATRKENMQDAVKHGTAKINADKIRAYWKDPKNREKQAKKVRSFIKNNPDKWANGVDKRRASVQTQECRKKMSDSRIKLFAERSK